MPSIISNEISIEPTNVSKWTDDVPPIIREATIAQASIFYKRGRGNWSDVLRNNEFGEERFVRKLDPAIQLMLQSPRLVRRKGLT